MSGTNPVFLVRRAKKQSGNKDAVLWCSDDFEAANATLDYLLIKTGAKLKDYLKAVATNFPVVNELPPEGELSLTFCDFYRLSDDNMTWEQIPGVTLPSSDAAAEARQHIVNGVDTNTGEILEESASAVDSKSTGNTSTPALTVIATMPFRHRVLAQFIGDGEYLYHVDAAQKKEIVSLEMDTDESYIQNLLLAAENVEDFKKAIEHDIHKAVNAVKKAFPVDGKIPELATLIQFLKLWFATDHIDRDILVREWAAGNRISSVQRTDSGTNADGGYVTDRGPDAHHTLDTLDLEIACALLPMDFNHFEIPGSILRRAKEIVTKKEEPWKSWSSILRNQPGVLGVNRTAIFNLVRIAPENIHLTPVSHLEFVNQTMTAAFNSAVELLPLHEAEPATQGIPQPESKEPPRKSFCTHEENLQRVREEGARRRAEEAAAQPQKVEQELVKNVGNGIFDVTALIQNSATHGTKKATETTSNVQVQETVSDEEQAGDEVQSGESSLETGEESHTSQQADVNQNTDSVAQNIDSVNQTDPVAAQTEPEAQSDEPAVVYPAYFEPGRYEGLPNEVYHAANGISSTQVKDARVSLMFYHGRHVTKTIRRESSEALMFGSLAHTLALEPEKLHEEFAVFPGIPAEAFTTTDSMKAFIREFNADKPKAEQLKLTGKKEELQAAIRAVSPEAIFADEFEQQWRDSVDGKTILSREQLMLATAIQQALLNHESAGKLLRHPSRSVETSYFGMDDETGLEVRVRPDLEVEINGVRIGVDLKTISMGRVKQDGLRAKLHREIIDRDYHLSAGMYCSVADFDQFFWIFVNKDEGYHWVAVIEASEDLLDLGLLEYQRTMRALANAYDTDCWSAPITEDYTDELNDFDLRRLEALRLA
ncbi:PD-(D/E)XK nuclease-like domain-containing protein [Citrobacter sp. Cf125]|uniref:RecE family exodeoxyribonuclease n=1 Tax=Citrobacter sp. Cf125 TaxID=2985075 RepID=UPI0025762B6B|nr:RecE family exodeoxyribonuclease [Citrobacter sp. Cf125]MDM3121495.1 PD-(D/E)XK nuclease-like domain-containing protein [Citrobacter sp. Cf125]